jgi:hypothetical protein
MNLSKTKGIVIRKNEKTGELETYLEENQSDERTQVIDNFKVN